MAITEESRHHLFKQLDAALGPEGAVTLMEHLPPVGWADVATKGDLAHLQAHLEHQLHVEITDVRSEIAALRGEITGIDAGLRGEMTALDAGLRGEMTALDAGLRGEIAALEVRLVTSFGEFRDQFHADQRTTSRQIMIALVVAIISLTLTSLHLH